jgi:hypothetical protein
MALAHGAWVTYIAGGSIHVGLLLELLMSCCDLQHTSTPPILVVTGSKTGQISLPLSRRRMEVILKMYFLESKLYVQNYL